jgi:hypothetical protein
VAHRRPPDQELEGDRKRLILKAALWRPTSGTTPHVDPLCRRIGHQANTDMLAEFALQGRRREYATRYFQQLKGATNRQR